MFLKNIIIIICLSVSFQEEVCAANLDIPYVKIYSGRNSKSWQEKLDVDCKNNDKFNLYAIDELNRILAEKALAKNIRVDAQSDIQLQVSITDYSCNENGLEDNFQSPLGLYSDDETTAQAFLRVVYEITDKKSQMLLDSGEIIISGENKEEKGNFTWYLKEHRITAFNPEKAWLTIADKIMKRVSKFL